ncbi:Uncharacterised protein [Vibrio cholerae]|nr:Uncharacterised protein [Vibrio cholerae]
MASISALSSPFFAVSSSLIAVSIFAFSSAGSASPASVICLRVAWIIWSAWLRAVANSSNFLSASLFASAS